MVRRTQVDKTPDIKTEPLKPKRRRNKRKQSIPVQIRRLRKKPGPIVPLSYLYRTFKELAPGLRIQKEALKALRECTEREAHGLFEASLAVMESSKKHSLTPAHMEAATNIPLLRLGNA